MNWRVLGFAILAVLIGSIGIYFFADEALDADQPLEFFQNHQYAEALQSLDRNQRAYPQTAYLLYKSYIQRELGNKQAADEILWKSVQSGSAFPELLSEAYLNLMLNAYLEENMELLKSYLFDFQRFLDKDREWLSLFMCMVYDHEGDSAKALEALAAYPSRGYRSPWMEQRFSQVFDLHWYAKHRVDCLAGIGETKEARRTLEEMKPAFSSGYEDEYKSLYGLSYLIEAENSPHDLAIPSYRLAATYVDSIKDEQFFLPLEKKLNASLNCHLQQVLKADDFNDLPFYVEMIEKWGGGESVQKLKDLLIGALDQAFYKGDDAQLAQLADTLSFLLKESRMRNEVALRFENRLETALQKEEAGLFESYWKMVLAFCDEDEVPHGKFSNLAAQKVLQSIVGDDPLLTRTSKNLDFYLLVEDKQGDSIHLADQLVMIAAKYWEIPQQRDKSMQLLKAAKRAAPAQHAAKVQASIEDLLKNRYQNALREDIVAELFDLITAVETLEIASVDIQDRQELKQQLQDAEYLYLQGNLVQALQKAEWVLAIDPDNMRARRLVGMIAYYFADYGKAETYLKGITPVNDEMREAQGVVAILSGDTEKGEAWLEEVKTERPIQEQIYLRLAYGFLSQEKPVEALEWIGKVDNDHPEVLPARIFAAYQLNSWGEVTDLFKHLAPPYANLDGYRGIVVDSLIALGEEKEAESVLDQLLQKPPQPGDNLFSPYFQRFKRSHLDEWNRFFVAGLYFKTVRNDPETALRYFDKIANPSVWAQVEQAEVYFQLGRLYEAKELLLKIDKEVSANQLDIKLRVLPLLGKGFQELGDAIEAIPFYQEYFTLRPEDAKYRDPYIRALMDLKRYDLALEQMNALRQLRALTPNEQIAWMRILLHRGEFHLVDQIANQWLSNHKVSLLPRLQVARMMIITQNQPLLDYIVKGIPEPSQRTIKDNQELIRLRMDLGAYVQALDLAQTLEKELVKTPEGLMLLAELYRRLSRMEESLSFAEKVLQINPTNTQALDFIERYDQHADVIASLVKLLKERMEDNPNDVALQVDYAKNLIELAMEAYLAGAIRNISDSIDLQQARLILERLAKREFKLPEVSLLLGKVYYLVDLSDRAEEEFKNALAFDPSYIEVLQHLALVYEEKEQMAQAIETVQDAAHFAPDNADVWIQLGNFYISDLNWKKAVDAYQNSMRFSPFDPDPYLHLASVYLKVKKPVEAAKTLEAMLAFSPQNAAGLSLMLQALYAPGYVKQDRDPELLQRVRIDYYDRLKSIDPDLAKESLPEGVNLDPE